MKKKDSSVKVKKVIAANDNNPKQNKGVLISCNLPDSMSIISGEAGLIAKYMSDILSKIANDNQSDK